MRIDSKILLEVAGIKCPDEVSFSGMGMLSDMQTPNMLSWLYTDKYVEEIDKNPNIKGIIITPEIDELIQREDIIRFVHEDPMIPVYALSDYVSKRAYEKWDTVISPTAIIDPMASIASHNVKIGDNTIVEAHTTIFADCEIGNDCIIRSGARIGSDNFNNQYSLSGQVLSSFSNRKAILKDRVDIGSNTCIDKSDAYRDTIIGSDTKIHAQVQICHGVNIGERCIVWGGVFFCGFVTVGDNVQFQPRALISNELTIEDNVFVGINSLVTKDVPEGKTVFGSRIMGGKDMLDKLKNKLGTKNG